MKQVVKMSVDIELELELGDLTEEVIKKASETMGYQVFDSQKNITKEAYEKEKVYYMEQVKNELENMEYKVINIYGYDMKINP